MDVAVNMKVGKSIRVQCSADERILSLKLILKKNVLVDVAVENEELKPISICGSCCYCCCVVKRPG